MIKKTRHYQTDLAIVGAGIGGCAAAVFARSKGLNAIQTGNTGALAYTSGYMDLLGVHEGQYLQDPWQGLARLRKQQPNHPYAAISDADICRAFEIFIAELGEMGLGYSSPGDKNHQVLLPAGVCKPTYCLPLTMQRGVEALRKRARVLVLDFTGLQGFSATEIVANLSAQWPGLRAQSITFPEMETSAPLFPEVMARALEVKKTREAFARRIRALAGDAEYIALPAMLGIHNPDFIHQEMEKLLGLPLFEIPTIPPGVAGIRLRELFEQQLSNAGVEVITQHKVQQVSFGKNEICLSFEDNFGAVEISSRHIILASGRFLSGGLKADRHQVSEALLGLPVEQPQTREDWFEDDYFDPAGHAINRTGVMVNEKFQPLDAAGRVIDSRLYAAGIVLAHQDWVRQRCGAGLAIATAYQAVKQIVGSDSA